MLLLPLGCWSLECCMHGAGSTHPIALPPAVTTPSVQSRWAAGPSRPKPGLGRMLREGCSPRKPRNFSAGTLQVLISQSRTPSTCSAGGKPGGRSAGGQQVPGRRDPRRQVLRPPLGVMGARTSRAGRHGRRDSNCTAAWCTTVSVHTLDPKGPPESPVASLSNMPPHSLVTSSFVRLPYSAMWSMVCPAISAAEGNIRECHNNVGTMGT